MTIRTITFPQEHVVDAVQASEHMATSPSKTSTGIRETSMKSTTTKPRASVSDSAESAKKTTTEAVVGILTRRRMVVVVGEELGSLMRNEVSESPSY